MTAAIAEVDGLLVVEPADAIHVVCCDKDLALCGSVPAGDFVPNETETTLPEPTGGMNQKERST